MSSEVDKRKNKMKEWYKTEGKKEVEELININDTHVEEERDSKVVAKKEIIECPYCLEDIYAGSIKYKHCKTDLSKK